MGKLSAFSNYLPRTSISKGFTLIELLVVIAIIGVLAAVLIAVLDPIDKINSANDTGVVGAIAQYGKAEDSYAVSYSNVYAGVGGTTVSNGTFSGASSTLANLVTAGQIKSNAYTPPTGYTVTQLMPISCTTAANTCTSYVFYSSALKSKANTAKPYYMWANGRGCFQAAAPTLATATCP